jgi:hypothetical protein
MNSNGRIMEDVYNPFGDISWQWHLDSKRQP